MKEKSFAKTKTRTPYKKKFPWNQYVYSKTEKSGVIKIKSGRKFGFIKTNTKKLGYFVPEACLGNALPNDTVFFVVAQNINPDLGMRLHARVVRVVAHAKRNIIFATGNNLDLRFFNLDLQGYIPYLTHYKKLDTYCYYQGTLDRVEKQQVFLHVTKKIGSVHEPSLAVLAQFGILTKFSNAAFNQANQIQQPETIAREQLLRQRRDLTNRLLVTIDGIDAKDFDDAIGVVQQNGNFILTVAIADVAHYIPSNSPIDIEAQKRGCSIYLPWTVYPMLPLALSENACSLQPQKLRLAVVCEMQINSQGQVLDCQIYRAGIKSQARLTYGRVDRMFATGTADVAPDIYQMLQTARKLAEILERKYQALGYIQLIMPKQKCEFNKQHHISKMTLQTIRSASAKLIELFMITANSQVAGFLQKKFRACLIFRNHPHIKSKELFTMARQLNDLTPDQERLIYQGKDDTRFVKTGIQRLQQNPLHARLIDDIVARKFEKAVYSAKNSEHFGLGLKYYTHFTSPIRRYADLMVHRLLYGFFLNRLPDPSSIEHHQRLISLCNASEKRQVQCEVMVKRLSIIQYMKQYRHQVFTALIKKVSPRGLVVQLPNLVQGELSIHDMKNDYYLYDKMRFALIGFKSKTVYRQGGEIKVRLLHIDF